MSPECPSVATSLPPIRVARGMPKGPWPQTFWHTLSFCASRGGVPNQTLFPLKGKIFCPSQNFRLAPAAKWFGPSKTKNIVSLQLAFAGSAEAQAEFQALSAQRNRLGELGRPPAATITCRRRHEPTAYHTQLHSLYLHMFDEKRASQQNKQAVSFSLFISQQGRGSARADKQPLYFVFRRNGPLSRKANPRDLNNKERVATAFNRFFINSRFVTTNP